MKKLKKLFRRFSVGHNLGLKIHFAREDVLDELLYFGSSGSTKKNKIITHISQTAYIIDMLIQNCQARCNLIPVKVALNMLWSENL